jgi:signal transduction histidine kinase
MERAQHLDGLAATVRLDDHGRISEATEEAATLLGTVPGRLLGQTLGDLAAERWRPLADSATTRILCGYNRSFQLLLRGHHSRRVLVEMAARPVRQNGRRTYLLSWSEHRPQAGKSREEPDVPELRRLINALLREREAERKRVVAQLDEGIAPLIIVSKFMIEDALRRMDLSGREDGTGLLRQARDRLRQSLHELERISRALRPRMLDDLGLLPTLEWFCRGFEQAHPALRVERSITAEEADIPRSLKLVVFRLVEEALSNVARHARASCVEVALSRVGDELLVSVKDDGAGFEEAQAGPAAWRLKAIGLVTLQKHVEASCGRLLLESAPGRGTRIGATWPIAPAQPDRGQRTRSL